MVAEESGFPDSAKLPNNPQSIVFLSVEDVMHIHARVIARDGGLAGVREPGLLASAVMTPQQRFGGELLHADLVSVAAAYMFHICCNHAFLDGNKRAALATAISFLMVNGIEALPDQDDAANITIAVAAGEMSKEQLTAWLRSVTVRPEQ